MTVTISVDIPDALVGVLKPIIEARGTALAPWIISRLQDNLISDISAQVAQNLDKVEAIKTLRDQAETVRKSLRQDAQNVKVTVS